MNRKLIQIEDYVPLMGVEIVERIKKKAETLHDLHVTNINSTYYGGGVAQLLSSLTLLMNSLGIKTGWRAIHGTWLRYRKKRHGAWCRRWHESMHSVAQSPQQGFLGVKSVVTTIEREVALAIR